MNVKKLFLLNLPYLLFVYPFDGWHRLSGLHPVLTSLASYFPSGTASRQRFPLRGSVSIPRTF